MKAPYVKAGSKIKFCSSNAEAYALESVSVNGGTAENAENGVCEIIMREEVSNLVANYKTVGTPISIYSEVSFEYKALFTKILPTAGIPSCSAKR